ncbi:hypothetical protein IT072_13540 [Leifsonia sp. ZF2019]|uniref:hypothetical protein n=1 Tax=Leifsonia sp. ZF2019 TaxID=2781978 RepID=UPI001CBF6533|nr:hypothetical protein [Leifsonia sp. ZF2019]UAJ78282.1 hypothetical protein IT072_13540 [Leifsonia sp. ZF2019]
MAVNEGFVDGHALDAQARLDRGRIVQDDLGSFVMRTRAQLAESLGPDAVSAHFGADGVLSALTIDQDARQQLTEDQLVAQIEAAFAGAPAVGVPGDPNAAAAMLDALIASASADSVDRRPRSEHSNPDATLTLLSIDGRPVSIRTKPGWILSEPSTELGAAIVLLARRAAEAAGDERGAK